MTQPTPVPGLGGVNKPTAAVGTGAAMPSQQQQLLAMLQQLNANQVARVSNPIPTQTPLPQAIPSAQPTPLDVKQMLVNTLSQAAQQQQAQQAQQAQQQQQQQQSNLTAALASQLLGQGNTLFHYSSLAMSDVVMFVYM